MLSATADISDAHPDAQVLEPGWCDFGGVARFAGPIETVSAPEDNSKVRTALEHAGEGRVLVIDGGGSMACALVGGNLGILAVDNGWVGIVVNGCVRDGSELRDLPLGIKALASMPRRSLKLDRGTIGQPVSFGGVVFRPGAWIYADADGIVVTPEPVG